MIYRNVLNRCDVDRLMVLYWDGLTNKQVGDIDKQTYSARIGTFMISEFTNGQFDFVWDKIKLFVPGELIYSRILRYGPGCHIPEHKDVNIGYLPTAMSNTSIIIQLSDPSSYEGGVLHLVDEPVDLNVGDIAVYEYGTIHSVTPVVSGIRFVSNLRIFV